jgi:GNAT superfamily N-acetyltransferase
MKIIELAKKHRKKAAVLLAVCFLKDPLFKYFTKSVKEENEKKKVVEALVGSAIDMHIDNGDPVYGIQKKKKIIGLVSMQNLANKMNPFKYIPVFIKLLLQGVGIIVIIRTLKFAFKTGGFFPKNTNYVSHLAVHPQFQKKGLGKKLIDFIIQYSKKKFPENKIALATNNKQNLPFYQRVSFNILADKKFKFFRKYYLQRES